VTAIFQPLAESKPAETSRAGKRSYTVETNYAILSIGKSEHPTSNLLNGAMQSGHWQANQVIPSEPNCLKWESRS